MLSKFPVHENTFLIFFRCLCSLPGNMDKNFSMSVLRFEPRILRFEIWHIGHCTKKTIFVEITKLKAIIYKMYNIYYQCYQLSAFSTVFGGCYKFLPHIL